MGEPAIAWWRLLLGAAVIAGFALLALAVNRAGPFAPPAPARAGAHAIVERTAQAPELAGTWHDDHGYTYVFDQAGDRYDFRLLRGAGEVGRGSGRIDGHGLTHGFTSRAGAGTCTGLLAPDNRAIAAVCHRGAAALAFRLWRGAS